MGTSRLEAFSDGVIAVAITLLVLTITVPPATRGGDLGHDLGQQWPQFAAYATSFLTIGIIWINHHVALSRLREADHSILILNLLLLMTIVILPFGTELMARYLRAGYGQSLAAAIYGGTFLLMAVVFSIFNYHVLMRRPHLLAAQLAPGERRLIFTRAISGVIPYAIATGLAVVSPYATVIICALIAVFYALPIATGGSIGRGSPPA